LKAVTNGSIDYKDIEAAIHNYCNAAAGHIVDNKYRFFAPRAKL